MRSIASEKAESSVGRTPPVEIVRVVRGLRSVAHVPQPPFRLFGPKGTAAKKGIAYEKKVIRKARKFLPHVVHGPWIKFEDSQGEAYCQPDGVGLLPDLAVVIESKYTENKVGAYKLENLYGPLCEALWGRPVVLILAFHNVAFSQDPSRKVQSLSPDVVRNLRRNTVYNYHFLG